MSFWCGLGAIFKKFAIFRPTSFSDGLLDDFGKLVGPFGEPNWIQNGFNNRSKPLDAPKGLVGLTSHKNHALVSALFAPVGCP